MTKIPSKIILVILSSAVLTGCLPIMYFFGNCADWNCNNHSPRWEKAVETCRTKNYTVVLQELGPQLGYKSLADVAFSDMGNHIDAQCIQRGGRYDVKKGEKYRHLFEK